MNPDPFSPDNVMVIPHPESGNTPFVREDDYNAAYNELIRLRKKSDHLSSSLKLLADPDELAQYLGEADLRTEVLPTADERTKLIEEVARKLYVAHEPLENHNGDWREWTADERQHYMEVVAEFIHDMEQDIDINLFGAFS